MSKEKRCSLCKFCTFEDSFGEFVCHNEKSDHYGEELKDYRNTVCDDYSTYNLKMKLSDALEVLTTTSSSTNTSYKLPNNDNSKAYLILSFDTNDDLEKYREAQLRVFKEVTK